MLTQDLGHIKPDRIPVWMWEGLVKSHPRMSSCWYLMTVGGEGGRVSFPHQCGNCEAAHTPVDDPQPSTQTALSGLSELKIEIS